MMDYNELVERCWRDHAPGSALARSTEAWNVALAFKDDLKLRLATAGSSIAEPAPPIVRMPAAPAPDHPEEHHNAA
jgi:hypothetical protein